MQTIISKRAPLICGVMKSVKGYPALAGDPTNIQFLTRKEHLEAHGGNWRNITRGRFYG